MKARSVAGTVSSTVRRLRTPKVIPRTRESKKKLCGQRFRGSTGRRASTGGGASAANTAGEIQAAGLV